VKRIAPFLVVAALAVPSAASGQGRGSVVLSGGLAWNGGTGLGRASATELRNPPTGSGPLDLFTIDARIRAAPAAQVRVGVFLSRRVLIEGGAQFGRPTLSLEAANDFEHAADTTVTETLTEYLFEGSLLYRLSVARVAPFLAVGAGQVRQVHDRGAELDTSAEVHAGGGIVYSFGAPNRGLGLRTDLRISSRSGGAGFKRGRRYVPIASAGLQFVF
jgi:hypothetical protein